MTTSLIYRSAFGYELLMRALYGRYYGARLQVVADEVPEGASVLELCCGPGTLYTRHLRGRASGYVGLDVNQRFVDDLRRQGVDARVTDLARDHDPLPPAEVAIMQASLYHFLPNAHEVIDRMVAAAARLVIVSEPVRNLASSSNPVVGLLGRRATDPGVGRSERRFTEATLDELFARYSDRLVRARLIPGGREKLHVLRAGY